MTCRVDVVAMICAVVNGLAQSGGNDIMLSTCLHILGSFALWYVNDILFLTFQIKLPYCIYYYFRSTPKVPHAKLPKMTCFYFRLKTTQSKHYLVDSTVES